jgi:inhibitor of cysteine peptidase
VVDAGDGSAIAGATVSDGTRSATTDASGNYIISNVPDGSYSVSAVKDGYVTISQSVAVVSGQTSIADFSLTKIVPVNKPMYVESIGFTVNGNNLVIKVRVASNAGAVSGAGVALTAARLGGASWRFSGLTDSSGTASFTIRKAAAGDYTATVTSLTLSGYVWDSAQGVTSASYTVKAK